VFVLDNSLPISHHPAAMNGITNMVGSLLTYGLGHINSPHLTSYQIIFLFFGVITVAYSAVVLVFMPDSPVTTKIFNEEEKLIAIERLRANQQGIENDVWNWEHVREAALDLKTWLWAFMMFSISVPSGGVSTFGPLIIQAFGYDQFSTILLNIPFGAVQLIATLGGAWVATKIRRKSPVLACLSIPPIIGCVMLLVLPRGASHKGPLLVAFYLISVYPGITPLIYSWSAANTAGETKKKVTTGTLIVFQCACNVVGPTLYTTEEKPRYARGLRSNLALFVVLIALYAIQWVYLATMNKKHAKRREAMGKSAIRVDESMHKVRAREVDAKEDEAGVEQVEGGDKPLDDRTDWQNEDFVYVF
jgi:Major Facilitator Superfamily